MAAPSQSQIASVRRFNRFYTREVGVLRKNFLETPWSLAEMRVLFEIANREAVTATDVAKALDLDAAYLSRMLQKFERDGLVTRTRSEADARVSFLGLSAKGRGSGWLVRCARSRRCLMRPAAVIASTCCAIPGRAISAG
jgi:DNA-binding MarR family transcriptional regulator